MEIKTLGDLRDFLNTLNEEQLAQRPFVLNAPNESSVEIGEADISDVTYFYNEDSEGIIPVEMYDPEDYDDIPLEDSTYNTIVPPGRVFIYERED